jgi:hypothetical protein
LYPNAAGINTKRNGKGYVIMNLDTSEWVGAVDNELREIAAQTTVLNVSESAFSNVAYQTINNGISRIKYMIATGHVFSDPSEVAKILNDARNSNQELYDNSYELTKEEKRILAEYQNKRLQSLLLGMPVTIADDLSGASDKV